jgi:hypothetical protein
MQTTAVAPPTSEAMKSARGKRPPKHEGLIRTQELLSATHSRVKFPARSVTSAVINANVPTKFAPVKTKMYRKSMAIGCGAGLSGVSGDDLRNRMNARYINALMIKVERSTQKEEITVTLLMQYFHLKNDFTLIILLIPLFTTGKEPFILS